MEGGAYVNVCCSCWGVELWAGKVWMKRKRAYH